MPDKKQLADEFAIQFQLMFHKLLDEFEPRAAEVNLSFRDISRTVGSSLASSFYEFIKEDGQKFGLISNQEERLLNYSKDITGGYIDKVELLYSPVEMAKNKSEIH